MKKGIQTILLALAIMCLLGSMAMASTSVLGMSGNIVTPNDKILNIGDFNATLQSLQYDDSVTVIGLNAGIVDNLEIGVANYNPSNGGESSSTILNAKYSISKETNSMPSFTVGIVDATAELDDDSSFFVVAGKNLTSTGSDFVGEPIGNLRGYVGIGGGIYGGLFLGADYTLTPKVNVVAEFISDDSVINAGVNLKITDNIDVNLNVLDLEDIGFGITWAKIGF